MIIKNKKLNQEGLTSIMLAMFITVVVSLLAIGYATLARRDQTATLDKNLSYQAQYAAESGVNRVIDYINKYPDDDPSGDCITSTVGSFNKSFDVGSAKVTCATWSRGLDKIVIEPSSTDAKYASFTGVGSINISWDSPGGHYGNLSTLPQPSSVLESSKPVIGLSIASVNSTTKKFDNTKRFYLLPSSNFGCGNQSIGSLSGKIICAQVDSSNKASATINGLDSGSNYVINANPINSNSPVKIIIESTNPGSGTFINTSQYEIDVNARSQDVTKRLIVYYSLSGKPADPYVLNISDGGSICKDYRVDGLQDKAVSTGASGACPNLER